MMEDYYHVFFERIDTGYFFSTGLEDAEAEQEYRTRDGCPYHLEISDNGIHGEGIVFRIHTDYKTKKLPPHQAYLKNVIVEFGFDEAAIDIIIQSLKSIKDLRRIQSQHKQGGIVAT